MINESDERCKKDIADIRGDEMRSFEMIVDR